MSHKASLTGSECINGFALGTRLHMGLECNPVRNIHTHRKQIFDAMNDPNVSKNIHPSVRRDFDQNVDVAVGAGVAAGARAEQGSMTHTLSFKAASCSRNLARISCFSMGCILPEAPLPGSPKNPTPLAGAYQNKTPLFSIA